MTVKDAPVTVDLFSGAGGLAEGLLKAGLDVAVSVEMHPQAGLTHAFNHPRTRVLVGDIRELDLDVMDAALHSRVGHQNVDLVVGGPPCQGFSSAGKKVETDPRNSLFRHYLRVVEHLRPRMFLIENVPGFRSRYGGAVYHEAVDGMHSLGYETVDRVVHMKDYGVPQSRRRFLLVGWLPGSAKPFEWPEPSHASDAEDELLFGSLRPFVTAREALSDFDDLEPGYEDTRYRYAKPHPFSSERRNGNSLVFNHLATRHRAKTAELIRRIPIGGSIRDVPESARGTKKVTLAKLHPDKISNTILSLPDDLVHYAQDRILTVREMARLQTFDDDFVFIGKRTSGFVERRVDVPQYTQVGNAVPPKAGECLGRALIKCLGASEADLRDIGWRRERHALICGSSGYSGYELAPGASREIELTTVLGLSIELPITDTGVPVHKQPARRDWTLDINPHRGQWAPGIMAKVNPSWMNESG